VTHTTKSITILPGSSGFNTERFQTYVDTLKCLHHMFARQVLEGSMDPFAVGQYGGFDTIDFSTCYFTSRRDDPFGDTIAFNNTCTFMARTIK
jgi:hypothetical protein